MSRDYQINGETLVRVKGGADHPLLGSLCELGLASEGIVVSPTFYHQDVNADDFGPQAAAEVMWNLAEVRVAMNLIHYDQDVLESCLTESMGGADPQHFGQLVGAGQLLGNNCGPQESGCRYVSLNLLSPVLGRPWRFRTAYLTGRPAEVPLGTTTSVVRLDWRAVPYARYASGASGPLYSGGPSVRQLFSSGLVLWDRELDT